MKNNLINILINILLINIFIFLFLYSKDIKENILFAANIWFTNLLPSIFPFLLISNLLINYNFIDYLSNSVGNIIQKLFNLSKNSAYAIVTSIFTGFPTGSIYTRNLLVNKKISIEEANHLIMFTSFSNPLFIISIVGETLLKSKKLGYVIFFIHLITGLIIGIIFKPKDKIINNSYSEEIKKKKSFIIYLINSINEAFKVLINILGIIIFSLIIITILDKTILNDSIISLILKGLIEITSGITYIANSNISFRLKAAIISGLISFNGISIHLQVKSIISDTKIKYKNFFLARITHAILCFTIVYLFNYL